MKEGMTDCYSDRTCYRGARAFQAMDQEIKVMLDDSPNSNELQILLYAKNQLKDGIITTKLEGQENLVKPEYLIGMNAKSDKKEAIQEILAIAFSKEVAEKTYSFSVQQEVFEKAILGEDEHKYSGGVWYTKDGGITLIRIHENDEWEVKEVMTWDTEGAKYYSERIKEATVIKPMDLKMLTIIQKESEDYFKGNISVDEAVEHIREKLDIYLSEQN